MTTQTTKNAPWKTDNVEQRFHWTYASFPFILGVDGFNILLLLHSNVLQMSSLLILFNARSTEVLGKFRWSLLSTRFHAKHKIFHARRAETPSRTKTNIEKNLINPHNFNCNVCLLFNCSGRMMCIFCWSKPSSKQITSGSFELHV